MCFGSAPTHCTDLVHYRDHELKSAVQCSGLSSCSQSVVVLKNVHVHSAEHHFMYRVFTSVFGHHGGAETLRLLEGDGQCGATAHAQTDHRWGLWGTCAGARTDVNKHDKFVNTVNEQNEEISFKSVEMLSCSSYPRFLHSLLFPQLFCYCQTENLSRHPPAVLLAFIIW